jgi:hypothetical protein
VALDFVAIENAVRAWLAASTGATVIFADQDGPQPALPYLTVRIDGPRREGGRDELRETTSPGNPDGQEIEQASYGPRELTVRCQAFTASTAGGGAARELLQIAQSALGLPAALDGLAAAGLAVIDEGAVQVLNVVVETNFQGRASLDLRLRATDSVTQRTGYIATVSLDRAS